MGAIQLAHRLGQLVVLHANGALEVSFDILLCYAHIRNLINLIFGHRRRARGIKLIKKLGYHSIEASRTPCIVSGVAM